MENVSAAGRPLGPQERLLQMFHEEELQLTGALVMVSTQQCPEELLEDACQLVAQRHPLLRMRVACDTSQKLVFEPIPEFKVNFAVDDSASLENVMQKEVMTPIQDKDGPLWKVTYLPNATPEYTTESHPYQITLLFTSSHVIADATAYTLFSLDFFVFLEQLHTSGEVPDVVSRPMPPIMMEFSDRYLGRKSFSVPPDMSVQHRVQAGFLQKVIKRNQWSNCLGFRPEDVSPEPGVGILRARLSATGTKILVAEAKKHHVTVASLLTAALSMAVHQMLPSEQSEVLTVVTADLRRMAAAAGYSDPDVIQQVAILSVAFWLDPLSLNVNDESDIWMLAAQCQGQLHGMDIMTKVFATLNNWEEAELNEDGVPKFQVLRGGFTFGDVGMNNIGLVRGFDRPDTAPFQAVEIAGCSAEHNGGKPVNINALTINNVMMFSLSYVTHMLSEKMAAELLKRFLAVLTDVTGE